MKRFGLILLIFMFAFSPLFVQPIKGEGSFVPVATFKLTENSKKFIVDNIEKEFLKKPILKNGVLFVPVRSIVDEVGGSIQWDGKEKSVSITLNSNKIKLYISLSKATVNGKETIVETPFIQEGSTFVAVKDIVNLFSGQFLQDGSIEIPKQLIEVFDTTGRRITVPKKVNKIVSLYPMATLLLFPLNMQDKIVAMPVAKVFNMDNFAKVFPKAKSIPDGSSFKDPNVETILTFKPDIVITNASTPINKLVSVNVPVALLDVESMQGILKSVQFLGTILGKETEAKNALLYVHKKLSYIETKTKYLQKKKSVYFALGRLTQTAGSTLIQNEIIKRAGGISTTSSIKGGKVDVSLEQILTMNPDYIILAPYCSDTVNAVLSNPALQGVNAVKNKHVYVMPQFIGSYDLPEMEAVLGVMWLSNILYPTEIDFDLKNEAKEFYKTIFNYNLTNEDLKYIFGS